MKKKGISLKWALMTAILLCWTAAVIIVISIAGVLINYNFNRNLEQRAAQDAEGILGQIEIRMTDSMESSKKISYDGVVRNAYNRFLNDGDDISLYRTVTQYLSGGFSRDAKFEAVFISFWEEEVTSRVYVINQKNNSYRILQQFIADVRPKILQEMQQADTQIRFLVYGGELYMCRNLLNAQYEPYATVTMLCDSSVLLQPLMTLASLGETEVFVAIDGQVFQLTAEGSLEMIADGRAVPELDEFYSVDVDDHAAAYYVTREQFHIWTDMPGLRRALVMSFALVIPILIILMAVFYKNVSVPVGRLEDAYQKVQDGARGYAIEETANSLEFQSLYRQFNVMSEELKSQFERSELEQQALQQAKIRALQSQINPHFLNNTLEVINWEARMAGNDKVSDMIDALSTMLEAALDRDGAGTVPLSREMEYVDAYLTIICRRLGDRLHVERRIDPVLAEVHVPKLMLQPIVENAVEHDITPRRGGTLNICARTETVAPMKNGTWTEEQVQKILVLEVSHEGTMTEEDRENIREILQFTQADLREFRRERGKHVGLRNVAMRLKLLFGEAASLTVEEKTPGMICASVRIPLAERS